MEKYITGLTPIMEEVVCPTCLGEMAVAHRCTCGSVPDNSAYSRCESCYRQVDWRTCPTCKGKGTITIN